MKLLNSIKNKFYGFIYDTSIDIKDRTFVLYSALYFAALIEGVVVGIFLNEPVSSTIKYLLIVTASIGTLVFVVKKKIYKVAKVLVAFVMIFFFQPLMFINKGGLSCGALFTLLLGTYYLVLVLEGKLRIILCLVDVVVLTVIWIIAYYNPDIMTVYTKEEDFIYSFAKYIIVAIVLTAIITFQTRVYQKEAKIAEEKSKELEEMNRSQNRFFSSMSHEIRTPINTVLGMNELILRQEDASDEIRKDASNIQGAGKMLLALINDILDISKIEAGKMDIVPVNYSVSTLLSEIVNMIWLKAEEKGLKFAVDIDPNVPEILFGDEVRIKQILINLLNNAVKYTKEGSVSLHMECDFPDKDRALLKINISDTGMGIKAEAIPHLFDSFQRQDEEKNRHIEGTGLGLSIVKQLVELMDGEISVNSVYEQGTTFSVMLKQGIESDKKIGDINIANMGSRSSSGKFEHSFYAPSARILIVDDNEMNLEVETLLIEGTQMTVDTAISGMDALSLTLKNRYDVIFMDHLMPRMNGLECFEKIRSQQGGLNRDVPIIVLTANAGGENIELYNNTGFDGYLVKPVSGRQLEDMLISKLPPDKVIRNAAQDIMGSSISTASGYARKKPIMITTSSMSDIPSSALKQLDIGILPFTIITYEGVFYDNIDIDSEELVQYMGNNQHRFVTSDAPTVEDFVGFFSKELSKAHHIVHITLQTGSSKEYERASEAAKSFDNVTVFNSGFVSSATGIMVMIAARLAKQNYTAPKIVQELEEVKKLLHCSFIIKNTDTMSRRGLISPFLNNILNALWLRPVLKAKDDKLGASRFFLGSERQCYEKYIKKEFKNNPHVDKDFAFITYAGMAEEDLLWIEELTRKKGGFEHIIFQKASAGITSNCGDGTFGLLYMSKGERNYNLGTFLEEDTGGYDEYDDDEEFFEEEAVDEADEASSAEAAVDTVEHAESEPAEKLWYESIDGIDAAAAIKNSGSKESFLSVLKIYFESYEAKADEIKNFYENEDWENYTIRVHALKSGSRLVGALKLGDDAEALEMAGKRGDIDYIKSNTDKLLDEYKGIHDALKPAYVTEEELPEVPQDMLEDAYGAMSEIVETLDYELARMVMEQLKEYKLPPEDDDRFGRIQTRLSQMDWDGIKSILAEKEQGGVK